MKRTTLKTLAHALELSASTVSRALDDHPDISEDTKVRVREAARAMRYVPNARARYLRSNTSHLIALILPEIHAFFVPPLITAITRVLEARQYSLLIFPSEDSLAHEQRLLHMCTQLGVDGVLLACSRETTSLDHLKVVRENGIPVVLLDKALPTRMHSTITLEEEEAARMGVQCLYDRGHRVILGVFPDANLRISRQRAQGFKQGHLELGLTIHADRTLFVDSFHQFPDRLAAWMARHPEATALFTMSDELLIHTHHALRKNGRQIPEEMSLVAISDGMVPYFLHPNVAHLRHSGKEAGEKAAELLLAHLDARIQSPLEVRTHVDFVPLPSLATRTV